MNIQLTRSINEDFLIKEQNEIKKYLTCIAVYDLPIGYDCIPDGYTFDTIGKGSPAVYITKYNKDIAKREHKLFVYNNK
jgi:hypothetical protein